MQLSQLLARVSEGEVVPVESINGHDPMEFVHNNQNLFASTMTIQDDREKAGIAWIFDRVVRERNEYNP